MADFIAVPAADLEAFLQKRKFVRGKQGNEVIYTRHSSVDPNLFIKVFTSIRDGQTAVRAAGRDALRICVVWDNGAGRSFGVGKFDPVFRVHSVESVLKRLDIRMREAAQRAKDWLAEQAAKNPSSAAAADARQKAAFAERERQQEQQAFLSDPDLGIIPPDPPSEPPQPSPQAPTFEQYAQSLVVPF